MQHVYIQNTLATHSEMYYVSLQAKKTERAIMLTFGAEDLVLRPPVLIRTDSLIRFYSILMLFVVKNCYHSVMF